MEIPSIGVIVDKSHAKRDYFKERKIAIIGPDESKWMTIKTHSLTQEQKNIPMVNAHIFPDNCSLNFATVNRDIWEKCNKEIEAAKRPSFRKFLRAIFRVSV